MLIFGIGKRTFKSYGQTEENMCSHCRNQVPFQLMKATTWFTLYFLPVIPYRREYHLMCPICHSSKVMEKEAFMAMSNAVARGTYSPGAEYQGASTANQYAGKTPTQIAYLEKIAAHEKAMEAQAGGTEMHEGAMEVNEGAIEVHEGAENGGE